MREEYVSDNQKPCEGVSLRASHSSVLGAKAVGSDSPLSLRTLSGGVSLTPLFKGILPLQILPRVCACVCTSAHVCEG